MFDFIALGLLSSFILGFISYFLSKKDDNSKKNKAK